MNTDTLNPMMLVVFAPIMAFALVGVGAAIGTVIASYRKHRYLKVFNER